MYIKYKASNREKYRSHPRLYTAQFRWKHTICSKVGKIHCGTYSFYIPKQFSRINYNELQVGNLFLERKCTYTTNGTHLLHSYYMTVNYIKLRGVRNGDTPRCEWCVPHRFIGIKRIHRYALCAKELTYDPRPEYDWYCGRKLQIQTALIKKRV